MGKLTISMAMASIATLNYQRVGTRPGKHTKNDGLGAGDYTNQQRELNNEQTCFFASKHGGLSVSSVA